MTGGRSWLSSRTRLRADRQGERSGSEEATSGKPRSVGVGEEEIVHREIAGAAKDEPAPSQKGS